jgi:hypothetical protein
MFIASPVEDRHQKGCRWGYLPWESRKDYVSFAYLTRKPHRNFLK